VTTASGTETGCCLKSSCDPGEVQMRLQINPWTCCESPWGALVERGPMGALVTQDVIQHTWLHSFAPSGCLHYYVLFPKRHVVLCTGPYCLLHIAEFTKWISSEFMEFIWNNINPQWHQHNIWEENQNVTKPFRSTQSVGKCIAFGGSWTGCSTIPPWLRGSWGCDTAQTRTWVTENIWRECYGLISLIN
jgi:hypothetical protein